MKANSYKLKEGITKEDLINKYGAREGGSWIDENTSIFISGYLSIPANSVPKIKSDSCGYDDELDEDWEEDWAVSINVGFSENLSDWNDEDWVLLLDEDFGQPYTPFYSHYKEEVINFPYLERVIKGYNHFMDSCEWLERVE